MSSYDEDGNEIEPIDWGEKADNLQKAFADIPVQVEMVRKMTQEQSKKIRREVRRVVPPKVPEKPPVHPVNFTQFAGTRRKKKGVFETFIGHKP